MIFTKNKKLLIFNLIPMLIAISYAITTLYIKDGAGLIITSLMMLFWSSGGIYLAIANSLIVGKNIKSFILSLGVLLSTMGVYCGLWYCLGESDLSGFNVLLIIFAYQFLSLVFAWGVMFAYDKLKHKKNGEFIDKKGKKKCSKIFVLNLLPIILTIIRILYVKVSQKIFFMYPIFFLPIEVIYFVLGGIYYTIINYRLTTKIKKKALGLSCISLLFFQLVHFPVSYSTDSTEIFGVTMLYQWITLLVSWTAWKFICRRKTKKAIGDVSTTEEGT